MRRATRYPLGYADNEARRLAAQAAYLQDLTADVLRSAGIGSGTQVFSCGVGDVSVRAARMADTAGSVLGIDRFAASAETARRRAASLEATNAQFEAAEPLPQVRLRYHANV